MPHEPDGEFDEKIKTPNDKLKFALKTLQEATRQLKKVCETHKISDNKGLHYLIPLVQMECSLEKVMHVIFPQDFELSMEGVLETSREAFECCRTVFNVKGRLMDDKKLLKLADSVTEHVAYVFRECKKRHNAVAKVKLA